MVGQSQRLQEGLSADTGSDYVLEGPWGGLPCSQEGKTRTKRPRFAASGHRDGSSMFGLLSI